jgi:(p)ppGpp synthase/HD superfamily hydrolase
MYSAQIEKAIRTATKAHEGQKRRGHDKVDYISHLFSVAQILTHFNAPEEVVIAGLLHDVLEDTSYSYEQLSKEFGFKVSAIVQALTEAPQSEFHTTSWEVRKQAYLESLRTSPEEVLLVSAADKIHNLSSLLDDYAIEGNTLFTKFKVKDGNPLWMFEQVYAVIYERLEHPITSLFRTKLDEAQDVLSTYKNA